MTIILDEPTVWPQKGRGGFMRNQHGEVVVTHPDTPNRTLIYDGASSLLDFGRPYRGDPIHGERGTAIHKLCDETDQPEDEGFTSIILDIYCEAEEAGIDEDVCRHIADEWQRVRAAHGITTRYIEQPVVHDAWRVATNVDRIDETSDGRWVVGDIKTAKHVVKASYLLQLAVGAGSIMYDPDSGERTPWPVALDQTVGHIWHYPIADAIAAHAAGEELPTWTLHVVKLSFGHDIGQRLWFLKNLDAGDIVPHCFEIAVPTASVTDAQSPPVVEQPDGGAVTHGNAAAPPSTLAEFFATYDTPRDDAPSIDVDELTRTIRAHRDGPDRPKTLAEWRADMETWDAAKRQAFTEWRFAHGITKDATDDERLAAYEQFHADYAFTDVTSVPEVRDVPARVERPAPPAVIDEGDEIPSSSIEAIGAAYKALPDDVRSWVTVTGAEVRLSPQHGGVASVRRYDIMRGLIALARAELDSDDMCRAACDAAIGTDTQMAWPIANVVGSLTLKEAKRFAEICVAIEEQPVALNFRSDGRPVVSRSVA